MKSPDLSLPIKVFGALMMYALISQNTLLLVGCGLTLVGWFVYIHDPEKVRKIAVRWVMRFMPARRAPSTFEKLDLVVGRTVPTRKPVIMNIGKTAHTAIFAQTGKGKTVLLYTIMHEIIMRYGAYDVQLAIFDLKKYSFRIVHRLPHLFQPVARPNHMRHLAAKLEEEMDRRAKLFDALPQNRICEDLDTYHQIIFEEMLPFPHLPLLVVIIDEIQAAMADPEVARTVIRIAKEARSVGFKLITATQRATAEGMPHEAQSQLETRFVGGMGSSQEYALARVPPDVYAHMNAVPGRFAFRYLDGWQIIQADQIPKPTLERDFAAASTRAAAWKWEDVLDNPNEIPEVNMLRPFDGPVTKKRDLVKAWMTSQGFVNKPTAGDIMSYFDIRSAATAYKYINEVWPEVDPRNR